MGQYTTNFNFELPFENEYYSIAKINANTAAIDTAIMNRSRREYVAAAPDTPERMKKRADTVCTATNAAQKIQELISNAADGDIIYFCPGTYNIYPDTENGIIINKRISLIGSGSMTVFSHKGLALNSARGGSIFRIVRSDIVIKDMMLVNYKDAANAAALIDLAYDGAEIRNIFFIQNIIDGYTGYCVKNSANSKYVRIEDCRVFRDRSAGAMPMFDFSGYDFGGIIGGMISSGADGVLLKFKDAASRSNTEIYACQDMKII